MSESGLYRHIRGHDLGFDPLRRQPCGTRSCAGEIKCAGDVEMISASPPSEPAMGDPPGKRPIQVPYRPTPPVRQSKIPAGSGLMCGSWPKIRTLTLILPEPSSGGQAVAIGDVEEGRQN